MIDVDSLIPKIDKETFDFDYWINELNDVDKKVKAGTLSWQDYSNGLEDNQRWIAKWGQETKDQIRTQEGLVQANKSVRDSILAHNETIKEQTLSAKVGKIAIKAFSTAGNMFAGLVITKGLELAVTAIDNWIHKSEKAVQAAKEAVGTYKESSLSIEGYVSKYAELQEQLIAAKGSEEETFNVKKQLLSLQEELNEKYGEEHGYLNLVTDAYRDQTDAIRELNREEANRFLNENGKGLKHAAEKMEEDNTYYLGSVNEVIDAKDVKIIEKMKEIADSDGILFNGWDFEFTGNANNASKAINKFMSDIRELQDGTNSASNAVSAMFNTIFDNSEESLVSVKDIITENGELYEEMQMAQIKANVSLSNGYNEAVSAVESYNNAMLKSEDPYNDKNVYKAWDHLQTVKNGIQENETEWGKYSNVMDNVFSAANDGIYSFYQALKNNDNIKNLVEELKGLSYVDLHAMKNDGNNGDMFDMLCEKAENYEIEVQDLIDLLVRFGYVLGEVSKENQHSFSDRFQSLWDSEGFSSAQENLMKLSREAGITSKDILSLARENSELSTLLDDSGISAQFAATCFQRVCDGADGFSAITDDAIALDQVLHEMDGSLQMVAASKSAYDKAMSQDDYNAEFKNYQDAYKSAMEMFENGDYGKHFRSAMEYLLGDESYTMSIEELKNSMDGLKSVFGEGSTNGLEFLDKLYEKKDILDGMDSSLEKLSDGSYDFDLKPDEFEKIGDALGMTKEEVAACTNALGMFGDYASYDIGKLEDTLKGMSVAAKDGKDSLLSLQGVESMLSNLGYNGYEIYHIMQDIQGMDGIKLIDFSADDENSLNSIVSQLKELDMIEINGDSINVESLIDNLRNSFNMASEDISAFITDLNRNFDFKDAEGKALSLNDAIEKVQTSENDETAESIHEVGTELDDATDKAQEFNSQKTTGIQGEFVNLKSRIFSVTQEIITAMGKIDELNNKKLPDITGSTGGANGGSVLNGAGGKTIKGTVDKILKKGKADASGNIGVKSDETALVNELGSETIIDPKSGTYEVVEGGAQFRKLKKGQIVLNHLQTKALLAKGKIASFGKMMFGGNATLKGKSYASGTAGGINPATGKSYKKKDKKDSDKKDSDKKKEETEKEFEEVFDWIERRIKKFQRSFDKWLAQAETALTSNFINKYYKKAASSAKSQMSTYGKAYNRYMREANAVGLDEKYAKKVRNGTIDIEEIRAKGTEEEVKKYEELAERIKEYQDWCNNYALLSGNRQENSI